MLLYVLHCIKGGNSIKILHISNTTKRQDEISTHYYQCEIRPKLKFFFDAKNWIIIKCSSNLVDEPIYNKGAGFIIKTGTF